MDIFLGAAKQIKAKAINLADGVGGTEVEKRVKAATSNEHYPTPLSELQSIANATNDYSTCREIMPLVWKRIGERPEYWRIVYKSLVLLRELIRFGSERVIDETRDHMFQLRQLESFRYQEDGKERGNGIREISQEIMELVNDQRKLQQVREESARNRNKYTSQSSSGGYGGGGSNSSWSSGGGSYDEGPSGKYSGFGGGSSSYDAEPVKKKKSSAPAEESHDDPYGEAPKKKKEKKSKKDRSPSPSPSPETNKEEAAGGEEDDEKAAKKKKKASKRAKEAAEAAKASAPKLGAGGKLAPPPAEAPDLFDPRASTSGGGGDSFADFQSAGSSNNDFAAFSSAAPSSAAAQAKPAASNTLDALFDFDGAPPARAPVQQTSSNSDFGFGGFSSASNTTSSNNWDAFANSTNSSAGSRPIQQSSAGGGFDLLSSAPAAKGKPAQQDDVFEAFQSSKSPSGAGGPGSSSAQTQAQKKPASSDAWATDLVKLDLGSSKPTPSQGAAVHIPAAKSSDPFSHLIPNQPRPMMGAPNPGQMGMQQRPGGPMGMQPGMGMGMGMQPGMGMNPMMGNPMMGAGPAMGFGMQQQPPQQPGFGFPQKKPNHDIFF